MENVDPGGLSHVGSSLSCETTENFVKPNLSQLPRELLLRVLVELANDVSALKSLCVTCRAVADIFRYT